VFVSLDHACRSAAEMLLGFGGSVSSRVYYKLIEGTIAGHIGDMRRQPVLVNGQGKSLSALDLHGGPC
jgi:hypothetical protein